MTTVVHASGNPQEIAQANEQHLASVLPGLLTSALEAARFAGWSMTATFWLPVDPAPGEDVAPASGNAYVDGAIILPWDKVTLNGVALPGLCKLTVPMIMVRLDDHKQPGFSGSPFVPLGVANAILDLEVKLLTPEDWSGSAESVGAQEWISLLWTNPLKKWRGAGNLQKQKQLSPKQAADVVPIWEIGHPMLEGSQIGKVAIAGYQPPHDGPEGPQTKVIKFKFRQWVPKPARAPSKPRPAPTVNPAFALNYTPSNMSVQPPSATKSDLKRK